MKPQDAYVVLRADSWSALTFFFFQAEDGIRDYKVTGVQTCALPIYEQAPDRPGGGGGGAAGAGGPLRLLEGDDQDQEEAHGYDEAGEELGHAALQVEIGRASCRERVESSRVSVSVERKHGRAERETW